MTRSKRTRLWNAAMFVFVVTMLGALGCGGVSRTESDSSMPVRVPEGKKVEFLVFSAKWCSVCRELPATLEQLKKSYPTITFLYLDVDEKENETLSRDYGTDAVPYFYIRMDGKVVARNRGLLSYAEAMRFLGDTMNTLNASQ